MMTQHVNEKRSMPVRAEYCARAGVLMAVMAALLAPAGSAWGQARTAHVWNEPTLTGIRDVGGDFYRYSSGLGGLARTNPYSGSVLGSSALNLRRAGEAGGMTGGGGFTPALSTKTPTLAKPGADSSGAKLNPIFTAGTDAPMGSDDLGKDTMLNLASYLKAMGYSTELKSDSDEPIVSFVPTEPSIFQDRMRQGEEAFRAGRYEDAARQFEFALALATHAPECHLSAAQALFALGRYYPASYHVQRALEYFPELPLLRIDLHAFYGNAADWPKQLARLREELGPPNRDPQIRLLLAYMQYFNGDYAETASLLQEVADLAVKQKVPEVAASAEQFWNGMLLAGKISGKLVLPASQPVFGPAIEPSTRSAFDGAAESLRVVAPPAK